MPWRPPATRGAAADPWSSHERRLGGAHTRRRLDGAGQERSRRLRRRRSGKRAEAPALPAPGAGMSHNTLLVFEVTILVLSIFLGVEVISKVPALLHTPLMSGTNAIHGIVIVGAMIV